MADKSAADRADRPLDLDELLALDNIPASRRMPGSVARELRQKRLYITGAGGRPRVSDRRGDDSGRPSRAIRLNPDDIVGLPGRSMTRVDPETGVGSAARQTVFDPFRPDWIDHVFHPKRTVEPSWVRRPRRIRGRYGELFWGVFGDDDRDVYYPSGYPWQCIGKVYAWNDASVAWPTWWGSAVLIGPRHVLTAGHVVPWDGTAWMMQFIPAYYDGDSILGAGAQSYVSDAIGWDGSFRSRLPEADDIAVLRLYDPLGDWLGYFGSRHYYEGYTGMRYFNINGYPDAVASAERPSYQPGIEVNDVVPEGNADELEHQGDTTGGNSGGPFWGIWPDGYPYAIGTISGGSVWTDQNGMVVKDTNVAAGGIAMHDLIAWARTNWP